MNSSLDKLSIQGSVLLLNNASSISAYENLNSWIELVHEYLIHNHPDTGLVAKWLAIGKVSYNSQYPLSFDWLSFNFNVNNRLNWVSNLQAKHNLKS